MMERICTIFVLISVLSGSQCLSAARELFWRDYTGSIPNDAVPGGYDLDRVITYIGQAFAKDGIIPGVIHYGVKEVALPIDGVKTVDAYIKILCSPNLETFKWIPTTSSGLNSIVDKYDMVNGGEEDGYVLYIGRVFYQGEVITGKIYTAVHGKAPFYFVHKNKEIEMDSYEVLVKDPAVIV